MNDPFIVHRGHARAAEYFVLDDDSSGDVAGALQGNMVADRNLAFDVYIRTNGAVLADAGVAANEHEVAQTSAGTENDFRKDDTILPLIHIHSEHPGRNFLPRLEGRDSDITITNIAGRPCQSI